MRKPVIRGWMAAAAGLSILCGVSLALAEGPGKEKKDPVAALKKATISLTDAVARAEEKAGGKAVEAGLEAEKDAVVFEVAILKDGVEIEVKIDAVTGTVLAAEEEKEEAKDGTEGKKKDEAAKLTRLAEALKAATVPLSGAILKAETETGGRAIEAELEAKKDGAVYEVKVIKDGAELEVVIDPATGKVVKVEKEGDDDKDDEK